MNVFVESFFLKRKGSIMTGCINVPETIIGSVNLVTMEYTIPILICKFRFEDIKIVK